VATDWSLAEVEATVTDYFAMLDQELRGEPYDKTAHRRRLIALLDGRSEGSIEFKHQNISAVLLDLGFIPIVGYKPRGNYQRLLFDVVRQRLEGNSTLESLAAADAERAVPVPTITNILDALTAPPNAPALRTSDIVREGVATAQPTRINYLEREARFRELGLAGEEFILRYERARLISLNCEALAERIEHTSILRGDGDGFDIRSFESSGQDRLIEVKTTKYAAETPFFVSRNELAVSRARAEDFYLYRVFTFRSAPRLFTLKGALSVSCTLTPASYVATVS
jgi:Domain of unknown function (DUF3883)